MKQIKKFLLLPIILICFLNIPTFHNSVAYADSIPFQGSTPAKAFGQTKDTAQQTIDKINGGSDSIIDMNGAEVFRAQGLNIVHIIAGLIFGFAVIMVVFAGFKITMSEGNEKTLREAKMQIILAGIGIGIALLTEVIVLLFQQVLGG
jgi:hypothetical protein